MAQRLAQVADNADIQFNSFLNGERVKMISPIAAPTQPNDRVRYLFMLGSELLLDGQSGEAAAAFEEVLQLVVQHRLPFNRAAVDGVQKRLALAYLRLGEQENCVTQHNVDRCLLPIRGAGVHQRPRGSRAALEALAALLQEYPHDLGYRWLSNLAYMTLGEYPEKVPKALLIPPQAFVSDYDVGRFPDVAPDLGLDVFGLSGGSVMDDFTGDGYLDILASGWGLREQLRLFVSRPEAGTFVEHTAAAGLEGIVGGLNLAQADYNNDGHLDVLVLRGAWLGQEGRHPNSLLRNNGDGTFSDATEEAGLLTLHPTQVGAWGDYDNDGWVDLFIGNESQPGSFHKSELFHNNGDGTFTDLAARVGLDVAAFVKGASWGDYNNDGLFDLYVSVLSGPNRLYRNQGPGPQRQWSFVEVGEQAGVSEPVVSFPTWFWDYNNDGWMDLFVSGYRATIEDVAAEYLGRPVNAELPRLYENNQDETFSDVTAKAGLEKVLLTMGCNFGDLDNDGFLDFYVGTGDTELRSLMPNRMFRNQGGRLFQDVTTSGGFGHLQKGHGVAFGDLDNDGDQDIYAVLGGAHSGDGFHNALFLNPGHGNRWLTLKLEGVTANRAALGARIKVQAATAEGTREIHATVGSGASFGASSLQQELGLGEATSVVAVEILWPGDPEPQRLRNLRMDHAYKVRQGFPAMPLGLRRLDLNQSGAASHTHSPPVN